MGRWGSENGDRTLGEMGGGQDTGNVERRRWESGEEMLENREGTLWKWHGVPMDAGMAWRRTLDGMLGMRVRTQNAAGAGTGHRGNGDRLLVERERRVTGR